MKRVISRQKNRANPVIQNSETPVVDYFRIAIYIPFIDHFISQLEERFANHKQIFKGFMCLLTGEKSESDCNAYDELLNLYIPEVPKVISKTEIKLWHNYLDRYPDIKSKRQALAHLELCNQQAYPNVYRLLLIFCTIPVSTATPERSFSTLKRIRTYLRNSTSQNRLNGLAMMSVHRELSVSEDEIIDEMAKKPRRLDFIL